MSSTRDVLRRTSQSVKSRLKRATSSWQEPCTAIGPDATTVPAQAGFHFKVRLPTDGGSRIDLLARSSQRPVPLWVGGEYVWLSAVNPSDGSRMMTYKTVEPRRPELLSAKTDEMEVKVITRRVKVDRRLVALGLASEAPDVHDTLQAPPSSLVDHEQTTADGANVRASTTQAANDDLTRSTPWYEPEIPRNSKFVTRGRIDGPRDVLILLGVTETEPTTSAGSTSTKVDVHSGVLICTHTLRLNTEPSSSSSERPVSDPVQSSARDASQASHVNPTTGEGSSSVTPRASGYDGDANGLDMDDDVALYHPAELWKCKKNKRTGIWRRTTRIAIGDDDVGSDQP